MIKQFKFKNETIDDYTIDNVNGRDYPDLCDAYVEKAWREDGTEFTEQEMEELNNDSDLRYNMIWERLH